MKKMHHCYACLVPIGEFEEPPQEVQDTIRRMGGMVRLRGWCVACAAKYGVKLEEPKKP